MQNKFQDDEVFTVHTGYHSAEALSAIKEIINVRERLELKRFYLCLAKNNYWQEIYFQCKPTRKQISKEIRKFVSTVEELNLEWGTYCDEELD